MYILTARRTAFLCVCIHFNNVNLELFSGILFFSFFFLFVVPVVVVVAVYGANRLKWGYAIIVTTAWWVDWVWWSWKFLFWKELRELFNNSGNLTNISCIVSHLERKVVTQLEFIVECFYLFIKLQHTLMTVCKNMDEKFFNYLVRLNWGSLSVILLEFQHFY